MGRYLSTMRSLIGDRRAVTSLEYGIIAGVLGLELINIYKGFGGSLTALFVKIGSSI